MVETTPAPDFSYYRGDIYWNNFPQVAAHLDALITGSPKRGWVEYLAERYPPVDCVLALNCGIGWPERLLFTAGLVRSVVGVDVQGSSLAVARAAAEKIGMPARYVEMDTNRPVLIDIKPQWALNYAALHHATFIDRLVREVYFSLPRDGLLINYDYVGPHRNQYGREAWSRMRQMVETLPDELRPTLAYPHMKTMLATDPTEAVHSELVLETVSRYFDIEARIPLGGALAYHLLYQNHGLYAEHETERGEAVIRSIIDADIDFTRGEVDRSLFAYVIARKKRHGISAEDLLRWSEQERAREAAASANGGRYYPPTEIELETYGSD